MFYIGLYSEKHEKIFKSETIWPRVSDIWYVASPGGPLRSVFKLCSWGQKCPTLGTHVLPRIYIVKNMKKSCLKPYGLVSIFGM